MAATLRDLTLGDLDHELSSTRRLLERIPDEHLGWKPHEKSFSLGELGIHIANLVQWQVRVASDEGFDLIQGQQWRSKAPETAQQIVERFDANREALKSIVDGLTDAALHETWTLRRGDHVVSRMPRAIALRTVCISHLIHHRGQMTVYLRQLDVPLPGMYGPTADEQ